MKGYEAGRTGRVQMGRLVLKSVGPLAVLCSLVVVIGMAGCKSAPTLAEQEQMVRANNLMLDRVTSRAVVNVWGEPAYYQAKFTQFFVMPDSSMIPSFRVPLGEIPRGWSSGIHAGEGVFFAYPDRGWLLGFIDESLVYKEEFKTEEIRELLKTWAYEDRFKTRLEGPPMP